jgi:hypothetical protein
MDNYTNKYNGLAGIILTEGNSIGDVIEAIKSTLCNQTKLERIVSAEWLGESLNQLRNS